MRGYHWRGGRKKLKENTLLSTISKKYSMAKTGGEKKKENFSDVEHS